MGFLSKIFGEGETVKIEEAVLIYIKLSGSEFGTWEEREQCFGLEDKLIEEIQSKNSGDYDGHEFGQGYCVLYIYGSNADSLYDSILDILEQFKLPPQSYVIKRYGGPGALEERVEFK